MEHRHITRTIAKTCIIFFLLPAVLIGCSNDPDQKNPTIPTGEHTIVVDPQTKNPSGKSECGSSNAPCSTLAAALNAAQQIEGGTPTIWLKAGSYQLGSAAPLQIRTSVNLRAEKNQSVEIHSEANAFQLFASNIMFEGLSIFSHEAGQVTSVMLNGGQVLFKNCKIFNQGDPSDPGGVGLSIDNGGHAILENSRVETFGVSAIEVLNGKLNMQSSKLEATAKAVRIQKNGRGTFEDSRFEGSIWVSGGSLSVTKSQTESISIADGAYATIAENTIRGSVNLIRKHAYAEIRDNQIYGGVSATDARATIETNKIYGNQQGEGVTALNFAMLTLTNNSISGMKNALNAHPSSSLTLNHNQFNSETEGTATIACDTSVTLESDGANTLRNADLHISCEGLPVNPGTENF